MRIKTTDLIANFFKSKGINQVFGVTGPATTYKITMKKIELCTGAPLADEHDTTCTGAVVVGTGDTTFDISSVTAGADVGNFVSTAGLPIGTKFTHAKPTMNREFTIKGYAEADSNCFCRTEFLFRRLENKVVRNCLERIQGAR